MLVLVAALVVLVAAGGAVVLIGRRPAVPDLSLPPAPVPATGLHCARSPATCGFPAAATTGVPAGTRLRAVPAELSHGPGWHYDPRGWVTVDGNGAVLDSLDLTVGVDITASNVTLRRLRIRIGGEAAAVNLRHTVNVTIEDTLIALPPGSGGERLLVGIKDVNGDARATRVLRTDISGVSTGVQIHSGLIQDCYIHDLGYANGDHLNGITSNGSFGDPLTIRHNTIFNQVNQTDAIGLFEDFSAQVDRVVDNNLIAGGTYTLYAGANPGGRPTSRIRVTDNHFARSFFPAGGSLGPVTSFDASGSGNVWSGNIWDDTGKKVTP